MDDIRAGVCPECRHNEIIEAPVNRSSGGSLWPQFVVPAIEAGQIMIYACRRCGHFEMRVADCAAIPIGAEYDTRLIRGPEPAGPYR